MDHRATPFLRIDAARVRANLDRLAAYTRSHSISVRPHTKTHKSIRMAGMQLDAGATGLTVAKVGEAAVMSETGADLLLAYPAVDPWRCERIAALALEHTVRVAVDSAVAADALSVAASARGSTIGILADMDVGMGRTGVQTPAQAAELAAYIDRAANLRLDGLFIYPGHIADAADAQGPALAAVAEKTGEALALYDRHGLATTIVSGGSTPTAYQSHLVPQVTEIRPGTYIYNDTNTVRGGFCTLDDCAATIIATVVSDAVPGQVVVDAGSKTLTSDLCAPALETGFGHVVEFPRARISRLTEEHGQVDVTDCDDAPKLGQRVTIIPNHICPCVNLRDRAWWHDGDPPESMPIDARGKVA